MNNMGWLARRATWGILCVTGLTGLRPVDAAIVAYTDYAAYQSAATGAESIIGFDQLGGGGSVMREGDVVFTTTGDGLTVYTGDTVSPSNYVGNNNFLFREIASERIDIAFDNPRSAAGIFVVFDNGGSMNTSRSVNLSESGGVVATTFGAVAFEQYAGDGTTAFFLGLVDSTGANSISAVQLQNPAGNAEYFFDSQTSFISTTAVPEPGSLMVFVIATLGWAHRRRRQLPTRA